MSKCMIKVLIITTVKIGYDGLTNHIFSYIKNMDKTDIQIDLVSARGTDEKIVRQMRQVGFCNIYKLEYRDVNQLKYFLALEKLIKKNKYDIVHAHGNSATLAVDLFAAKVAGCKVRIAHSHTTSCQHKVFNMVLRPLFNISYTQGFACGQAAGTWLFGKKPFIVLPNGKDIDKFKFNLTQRNIYRDKLKLDSNTIAIGNVAAFVQKKNHKFCIDIFRDLLKQRDNYEMFLFGINGETLDDVKKQIKELGLDNKIHYMGTKDNIQDYLQAMDIMMLPSLYEGFPVSVIEWQINGLPCLLSDTITKDVDFLDKIIFLPLTQGTFPWIESILSVDCNIDNRTILNIEDIFTKIGFNIKTNSADLKKMYFDMVIRSKL